MSLPPWLIGLSIAALVLAVVSAASILYDIVVCKRQMMAIMTWVWPITALYMGPLALWAYRSMGLSRPRQRDRQGTDGSRQPFWQTVFKGTAHCGGGCTLGDIIGEWGIFIAGVTLAGLALWPEYIADFLLAYALGIVFQYFSIAPMRGLSLKDGLIAALKADTLSLIAFEVGLFGWMAFSSIVLFQHHLHPDSPVYWFMMQLGMIVGFATSYPMNWWLLTRGIKEPM